MIVIYLGKTCKFKVGDVVHLKVAGIYEMAPGKWALITDDVTPLPGAEPTGYACHICGIIEVAKPDGSLPDGWISREYKEGSCFICRDEGCQIEPMCRVCGCSKDFPCHSDAEDCYWVKPDLCSACVEKKGEKDGTTEPKEE